MVNSLEDRDSVFLWSRGNGLFLDQYNEDNASFWGKAQAGLLAAHYKRCRFPMLEVPQLCDKPTLYSAST